MRVNDSANLFNICGYNNRRGVGSILVNNSDGFSSPIMPLDYSHQDLQGSDFKGRDLAGKNFSHADVPGTNFTDAILTDANFTNARAGLQRSWAVGLVTASLFLSLLSGILAGFIGMLVVAVSLSKLTRSVTIVPGLVVLICLAILLIVIIRKGLVAVGGAAAVAGAAAAAGVGVVPGVVAGGMAPKAAGEVAGAAAVVGAVAVKMVASVEATEIVAVVAAVVGVGIYVAWRALAGDEKYAFVRRVALFFAAIGGTSFQGAYLTNADFTQAKLRCTKFLEARLTRTRFGQAEKLNLARVGKTILNNSSVRNLLTTGS
ncbi:MAG: hypothetical protein BRC48_13710 [Cyanobacteria bacterium QS_9_48_30]|nr:MAG: hypothetical protein BRC48_13710 [Cyanobacteria bacterium QS_9_48_30]